LGGRAKVVAKLGELMWGFDECRYNYRETKAIKLL
jgi:hypothetical protein